MHSSPANDGLSRIIPFAVVAVILSLSFFARHIAGMVYTHFQYSCLVYNPRSVRESPPVDYDFLPDPVSWDETRAYARWTNEILRGEWGGPSMSSFAPFLTTNVPPQPLWWRDRLGPAVLAGMAKLPGSDVQKAFLIADFIFPFGLALSLLSLSWEIRPSISFAVTATCLVTAFNWQDVLNLLYFIRGARQSEATFLRTPYPQFSGILLCLFLISLIRLLRTPRFGNALVFALLSYLNFLTYFYSLDIHRDTCWLGSTLDCSFFSEALENSE